MTALAAQLFVLEQSLQTGSVRKSAAEVKALLTENFREVGSSGRVYDRPAILAALQDELPVAITMSDFAVVPLAEGVALVTYTAISVRAGEAVKSLRSSVWLLSEAGWRMVFHQGTVCESQ